MKRIFLFVLVLANVAAFADTDEKVPLSDRWAAVAFSRQGRWMGRAISEASEYLAKETAIRACSAKDCEIKSYVERGCIGIANGSDKYTFQEWFGFGASQFALKLGETVKKTKNLMRLAAGEVAKNACETATHGNFCNVTEIFCTWDNEAQTPPEALVLQWIQKYGGEQGREMKYMLNFVNVAAQRLVQNLGVSYEHSSCLAQRRWISVERFSVACELTIDEMERIYVEANRH